MTEEKNSHFNLSPPTGRDGVVQVALIECPRDAMQGWPHFIPTSKKIEYINTLLQVGFNTIDFGSFVSPKAIPQMADTAEVIKKLEWSQSTSRLLAIVANKRGAQEAVQYDGIRYLGFPFSISPTFARRNTNGTIEESLQRVEEIQSLCIQNKRQAVIYLSMGFGNPYGDAYNEEVLLHWADQIAACGISIISLADTVGVATPEQISKALNTLISRYPDITFGVHLHAAEQGRREKMDAAYSAGCRRFDGALKGYGGCPMAKDDLVGNMATEWMITYLDGKKENLNLNVEALQRCLSLANEIFT